MASTLIALLIFAFALYYLFWGGRALKHSIAKQALLKIEKEEAEVQELATFRFRVANKQQGFILDSNTIIYRSQEAVEKIIDLSNVAIFAEHVSDDDMWSIQYHSYIIIDRAGKAAYWNADHFAPETIDEITAALGTRTTEQIVWRLTMTSRIMYPIELWGKELYDDVLSIGEKNWVYTQEVKEYLRQILASMQNP